MTKDNEGDSKEVKPETALRTTGRTISGTKRRTTPRPPAAATRRRKRHVTLRSLWPGRLVIPENRVPSGKRYEFPSYGFVLAVDEKDADELLSRRRGTRPCCGPGQVEQKYFELV